MVPSSSSSITICYLKNIASLRLLLGVKVKKIKGIRLTLMKADFLFRFRQSTWLEFDGFVLLSESLFELKLLLRSEKNLNNSVHKERDTW